MNNNGSMKELKIFVQRNGSQKRVSIWRFFPNLDVCFRTNGYDWKGFNYDQAMRICKRIMNAAKTDRSIQLRGTMIDELEKENKVSKLFSGEKIVLG